MGKWVKCTLGEIGNIVGGATPSTKNVSYYCGDIPWVTPKDLSDFKERFIYKGERSISRQGLNSCSAQIMPANSILFTSRAPIGYVAISGTEMCTNQGFKSIVPNEKVDYLFLYYLLNYKKNAIEAMGSGTTFKEVSGKTMRSVQVCIPEDIIEQKKIASVLGKLDDKIENNKKINDNLQQQANALFDEQFPSMMDGDRLIGDYITPKRGRNLLSKDAIPGDVPVVAGGLEAATYHNTANTVAPVLTISASGANAGFLNLWHKPVWSSDSSFIDSAMTDNVFFWYVLLKKRQKEIFDAQTGSAQPHIYPQHIAAMRVPSLNATVVTQYVEQVTSLFSLIGANKVENDRLATLRDILLPKLMSGEIDVSDVEI